jgi:hypothetical protein
LRKKEKKRKEKKRKEIEANNTACGDDDSQATSLSRSRVTDSNVAWGGIVAK